MQRYGFFLNRANFLSFFFFLLSYGLILLGLTDGAGGVNGWNVFLGHGCWQRERWGESCSWRGPRRGIFWGMVICVCVITMRAPLAFLARLTGMVIYLCVITMRASLASPSRLTGMVIYLCVITMRASLASPSRLTGMVICVCVIAIVEKMGECRFWI